MIKQIIEKNKLITKESIEKENFAKLISILIDANGRINISKLSELLNPEIADAIKESIDIEKFNKISQKLKNDNNIDNSRKVINESYGLNFLGKSLGKVLARQQSTTIFVPDESNESDENKDSKNIYITADNLEALRHLRNSYAGRIKCIYIDPPYNTGSDGFCYPDKFSDDIETLKQKYSVDDNTAQAIIDMTSNSSSSHNAWLSFMYPRLLLAREILSEDGGIFISVCSTISQC